MPRQKTQPIETYRRQVHARYTPSFSHAAPTTGFIDPRSNDLVRGLAAFATTSAGIVRERREATFEAEALAAKENLSAFKRELGAYLENTPDRGLGDPASYQEDINEMRAKYFDSLSNGKLKNMVNTEVDVYLKGQFGALQEYAEGQQREKLGKSTLLSAFEEVQQQMRKGGLSRKEALSKLQTTGRYLLESEAIAMNPDSLGKYLVELQSMNGEEQDSLIAEAFEDSELISVPIRADLKRLKQHAEALKPAQRELARLDLMGSIEGLINKGKLTKDWFKPYIAQGIFSASDAAHYLDAQKKRQAQAQTNLNYVASFGHKDLKYLPAKDQQTALQYNHSLFLKEYGPEKGQQKFDALLRANGVVYKTYQSILGAGLTAVGSVAKSEDEVPRNTTEGYALYKRLKALGMADAHLTDKEAMAYSAIETHMELMGSSFTEAYNTYAQLKNNPYAQTVRLSPRERINLGEEIKDELSATKEWGWFKDNPQAFQDIVPGYLARLRDLQAMGIPQDKAKEIVLDRVKNIYAVINGSLFNKRFFGPDFNPEDIENRVNVLIEDIKKHNPEIPKDKKLTLQQMEGGRYLVIDEVGVPFSDKNDKSYLFTHHQLMGKGANTATALLEEKGRQELEQKMRRNQALERIKGIPLSGH